MFNARSLLFIVVSFVISHSAICAGPQKVASYERVWWPETIDTKERYNRASYYENKMFQNRLETIPYPITESELSDFTKLQQVNAESANKWLSKTRQRIQENIILSQSLAGVDSNISSLDLLPESYQQWREASESFYQTYLYEQLRLAALFPRITSEIDTLVDQEKTGFELQDGQFLLSFDDGPSSLKSQKTEKVINWLTSNNINGFFFLLGENIEKRQQQLSTGELASLYSQQCVASHGFQHNKHTELEYSTASLAKTDLLIKQIQPSQQPPAFRPPYGQRSTLLSQQEINIGRTMIFWNIDSQDWNRKLNQQAIADRVTSLMLLWRKGIILFHDIHDNALFALPQLNQLQIANETQWVDCKTF
jgi:peptidoglycan/xylan/chitin deacetylase (PgdA/CDA1 family)